MKDNTYGNEDGTPYRHYLIYGSSDSAELLATPNSIDGVNGGIVEFASPSLIRRASDI